MHRNALQPLELADEIALNVTRQGPGRVVKMSPLNHHVQMTRFAIA